MSCPLAETGKSGKKLRRVTRWKSCTILSKQVMRGNSDTASLSLASYTFKILQTVQSKIFGSGCGAAAAVAAVAAGRVAPCLMTGARLPRLCCYCCCLCLLRGAHL